MMKSSCDISITTLKAASFNFVVAMVGKPWLSLGNYVITPLEVMSFRSGMFHALDVWCDATSVPQITL